MPLEIDVTRAMKTILSKEKDEMPHAFKTTGKFRYIGTRVLHIRPRQKPTNENTVRNLVICTWSRFQWLNTVHEEADVMPNHLYGFQGAVERNIQKIVV